MSQQTKHSDAFTLPKEYASLKDADFPLVIGGINYRTKQELADRYQADLTAFAELIFDIWQNTQLK
jgi:hypothetical protein